MINLIQPPIYENCFNQKINLYKNLDVNLSYQWTNRVPRKRRRRRRRSLTNFKILYKRLHFLKKNLKLNKNFRCKFSIPVKTKVFSQNKFYILSKNSYFVRALNNSLIYKKHDFQSYKFSKITGFTFNKEKIRDIKILPIQKKYLFSDFNPRLK